MIYKTQNNQSIFDLIINTIVNLDDTYALILANPIIKSIASVPIGVDISYIAPSFTPPSVKSTDPEIIVTSKNFYSRNNQTVYDIVLQTYGNLDLTYKLIIDSNFDNIQTYPIPTNLFIFNPQLIIDNSFSNYLKGNGIIINTRGKNTSELIVYGDEDSINVYISEDGTEIYTPEN